MARRRKYDQRSKVWSWISFVLFSLVVALLGYSVFKKESPAKILKSIFTSDMDPDDIRRLSKKELVSLVEEKDQALARVQSDLDQCQSNDGHKKGIISTTSPTLNMRSEASLEGDIIIRIPSGSEVSILYYDERELLLDGAMGQWCKIRYADQEGWVWGNYVELVTY